MILHLTVSADGYISLWDAPGAPFHGKNVELELSPEQNVLIRRAMRTTKREIGDGVKKGPYFEEGKLK